MIAKLGRRFWGASTLATLTGLLALLTAVWPDWIERTTGLDPDHHSGVAEWLIVVVLALVSIASSRIAATDWRRATAEAT